MATILVAEDEPAILGLLAEVLQEDGHAVVATPDGAAALAALERAMPGGDLPDLVVTDAMMPRLDGPALVRRMRATPAMAGLPVLITSAAWLPDLAGLEPVGFLAKPFELDALLAAVGHALGRR